MRRWKTWPAQLLGFLEISPLEAFQGEGMDPGGPHTGLPGLLGARDGDSHWGS